MEGGQSKVSSNMQWREVAPMPSPKNGLRGASVGGLFHVVSSFTSSIQLKQRNDNYVEVGGNSDYSMQGFSKEVLAWDPVLESWQVSDFDH